MERSVLSLKQRLGQETPLLSGNASNEINASEMALQMANFYREKGKPRSSSPS